MREVAWFVVKSLIQNYYVFHLEDGTEYVAFCDSGYALGHVFITPYSRRRNLSREETEFNR